MFFKKMAVANFSFFSFNADTIFLKLHKSFLYILKICIFMKRGFYKFSFILFYKDRISL